jgi:hypothetical protein
MRETRSAYKILLRRPEGKSSLVRPRRRWEDNNKMNFEGTVYYCVDWILLGDKWLAVVNTAMKFRVLEKSQKLSTA